MAKKKSIQNKTVQKAKFSLFRHNHPLATAALLFVLIVVGFIGYNKFLDYRNVQDMKALLSDFQQLERGIEADTGEDFFIKAKCSNNGQFLGFYSCSIRFNSSDGWKDNYADFIIKRDRSSFEKNECEMLSKNSVGFEPEEDNYGCSFIVRPSNQQTSEEIFFDYDTNPGWPL